MQQLRTALARAFLISTNASDRVNTWLSRFGGVGLTIGIVMIVGLMIVPTTPQVMDVLIGANIACAITVLLTALYIQDAMRLPSFPTILLITTLFRLTLNVSSTRLILTEGDAGEIINAFGDFVVGGNFVVGAVIFLIITLIQFIVITKGAERVAEVSARFTLDAIPGKQMAIDADLRANLLKPEEAREKRLRLERENKLYGAMDGAMKFVKGDAIAGIIVSLVNVVGGLVIGHMQMGMSLSEAAAKFTLLSIGDGLVSQFPALLISVAAGIVVTRVASSSRDGTESSEAYAGREVIEQFLGQPIALASAAAMLLLLALLPTGLPWHVFVGLAAVLGIISIPQLALFRTPALESAGTDPRFPASPARRANTAADKHSKPGSAENATESPHSDPPPLQPFPTPVEIELGTGLAAVIIPQSKALPTERVLTAFNRMQESLQRDLGVVFPSIRLLPTISISASSYVVKIFECPVISASFSPDDILLPCPDKEARRIGFATRACTVPWNNAPGCLIASENFADADQAGLRPLRAIDVVFQHVLSTMRRHAAEFVGVQDTQRALDAVEQSLPDLKRAVTQCLSLPQITAVLQRLLAEEVPIRNLRSILETLARLGPTVKHPLDLAEAARRGLGRMLCHRYARGGVVLHHLRLASEIEELVRSGRGVSSEDGIAQVALKRDEEMAILAGVTQALHKCTHLQQTPVIMTRPELRPFVRSMLVATHPQIVVLSDAEAVSAAVQMEWMGDVAMAG